MHILNATFVTKIPEVLLSHLPLKTKGRSKICNLEVQGGFLGKLSMSVC